MTTTLRSPKQLNYGTLRRIYQDQKPLGFHQFITEGIDDGTFKLEDFSFRGLARVCGVTSADDFTAGSEENLMLAAYEDMPTSRPTGRPLRIERLLAESNPGVSTNALSVITGELIANAIINGYDRMEGLIGDRLTQLLPNQTLRSQRIAGITAVGANKTVNEGHPYEETGFEDKFVTSAETKEGRILSINEESLLFDKTGLVALAGGDLGENIRVERERTIVRGVTDAEQAYRPSGTAQDLYNTDGSNRNYIGVGNTTSPNFNAAVPLVDWTDVQVVREFRAVEVIDDRIDGTQRPIGGLSGPVDLLVPEALLGNASYIANATEIDQGTDQGGGALAQTVRSRFGNPASGWIRSVLSSPFVDEDDRNDWYYGDFAKQFLWTEIWPLQTFTQGSESEASFERDVVFRIKARYYGGITARDTRWVVQVDGA